MRRLLTALSAAMLSIAATIVLVVAAQPASAASLTRVTDFGSNPSNLNMYTYVPDHVASHPALLVAIHYCTGSASAAFNGPAHDYVTAADQYGYVIVFPEATRSGQCFDVSSPQALTRGGGSDPVGILSMVNWTKQRYNVDSSRVYVTGFSSGAMMTNVLAAEYPDVFAAGSAFMGVPAGCFGTTDGSSWNSQCANGQIIKTAQQWGDQARQMSGGRSGPYPRMQLWHGTADETLRYPNFGEEIKQWTNLQGVIQTPSSSDSPQSGWTRTRYGGTGTQPPVEGISVQGVGHALPQSGMVPYAIAFLGLNSSGPGTSTSATTTTTSSPPTTSTTTTTTTPQPCTAVYAETAEWNVGFNGQVTVSGTNNWVLTVTFHAPQKVTGSWNYTGTWDSTGYVLTARPNGSGNVIGFTVQHGGNLTAPTVTCAVG